MMANDRNTVNNKPFLPRLASTKSPITPRLATQHLKASASPTVALAPSPRLDTTRSNAIKSPVIGHEDINTPVKTLLNSNITPRSSLRKSRLEVGSNVSTPTGTPVDTPMAEAGARARSTIQSHGFGVINIHKRPQSVIVDTQSSVSSSSAKVAAFVQRTRSDNSSPSDGASISTSNGSFFHANDAKAMEAPPPRPQAKKAATFLYANGEQERRSGGAFCRSPSPTVSTMSMKSQQSQFYHTDDRSGPTSMPPRSMVSVRNTSPESRPAYRRAQSSVSSTSASYAARPNSPQKSSFHLTFRKGVSQVLPARPPIVPSLAQAHSPPSPSSKRRSTIETDLTAISNAHVRGGSLGSIDMSPSSRKSSLNAGGLPLRQSSHTKSSPTITSNPRTITSEATHHAFKEQSQEHFATAESVVSQSVLGPTSPFLPQSPGQRTVIQAPANLAEAAANARRERKVLDLEISNSSLLAINRQLEREVRRQKMELRRFRRLSRAGRLSSTGSTLPHHGDMNGAGSDDGGLDDGGMPYSDDEDASEADDEDLQDLSSLSEESLGSSAMSVEGFSGRGAARLEKDEKRLKMDLDRHRQLLVDSQKMNQSLKRCMTWTEEMIAEGKKALAYKVNVSDVRLGGRVLQEDDMTNVSTVDADDTNTVDDAEDITGGLGQKVEPRKGLLGSWSPLSKPSQHSPIAERVAVPLGLTLALSPRASNQEQNFDIAAGSRLHDEFRVHNDSPLPIDHVTADDGYFSHGKA